MAGNGKNQVNAHFDNEEFELLAEYMRRHNLEAKGNAVRKLAVEALEERDPRNSWLLHAGLAAMLWSILSVIGTVRLGVPDPSISLFSIYMAALFLTGHAMQLVHAYGVASLPVVGRLFGRPVDR